ncbi:MAG: GWxTD domain-containing protein [Acidobacteriota bacterium]
MRRRRRDLASRLLALVAVLSWPPLSGPPLSWTTLGLAEVAAAETADARAESTAEAPEAVADGLEAEGLDATNAQGLGAKGLGAKYVDWLEMVDVMITDEEKSFFTTLDEDFRRDAFIEQFWKVRDPDPLTHMNELRRPWEERADIARSRYPSLLDSRSRVMMLKGEPYTFCLERVKEMEVWYYEVSEEEVFPITLYTNVQHRPYEIYQPGMILNTALRAEPVIGLTMRQMCGGINPELMAKEITRRYDGSLTYEQALERFLAVPEDPPSEWVATFASATTDLPPDAETFEIDFEVAFPGYYQQRTVVEGIAVVPAGMAGVLEGSADPRHHFQLTGEIVRDGKLFDNFRYSFELPASLGSPPPIPLIFQRYLRPGEATLLLRIEDLFGRQFARVERKLDVPKVRDAADVPQLADSELMRLLAEANEAAARGERILRLVAKKPCIPKCNGLKLP